MDFSSLPMGLRFCPTDLELIWYLRMKVLGQKIDPNLITEIDIYKHEPWDLHAHCSVADRASRDNKFHFFTRRDKKYPDTSSSPDKRSTKQGSWKSTGKDCTIKNDKNQQIGSKKTLVFHLGRSATKTKSQWLMHEFYLHPNSIPRGAPAHLKDLFVLCLVIKWDQLDDQGQDQLPLHQEAAELPPPLQSDDRSNANASTSTSASTSGVLNPNPLIPDDTILDGNTTIPDDNTDYQKDDLDWMQEMYDPNFIPSSLLHPQFTVGSTPSAPKPAPAYYSPAQASEDETSFPLPEDIQNILGTDNHQNTQNLHFLEDQTTPTTSAFYCNVPGRGNEDDETGIVIRQRSATVTYDNPNDTDVSNINKYNLKSKLQMHHYKKDEETLQTANFAPKDGLVGEFDNSASISGKDGYELKSTMPKRTELRRFGHGALLVGGVAMMFILCQNNSIIFS